MSEEPHDNSVATTVLEDEAWAQLDTTGWDDHLQAHVRRIKKERGIGAVASAASLEGEEQDSRNNKAVSFTDARGIERRPAPYAAECYASQDVQAAVSEYFTNFDNELLDITDTIERFTKEDQTTLPKPFDPLDELMRQGILKRATEQLPGLTKEVTTTEPREVTAGRVFKHTETVYEEVVKQEFVAGYISASDDERSIQSWRDLMYKPLRSNRGYSQAELSESESAVQSAIVQILTGTELTVSDQRQHQSYEQKLPLLATRLRDSGIHADAVADLSWDDIAALVPEVKDRFADIAAATERQTAMATLQALTSLEDRLRMLSPARCDTIARLYYTDEQIGTLDNLGQRLMQLKAKPFMHLYPTQEITQFEGYGNNYIDDQNESIATFFDGSLAADTLLVHGSHFAPRVIRSGALKPAQAMAPEEFTFATDRNKVSGVNINGSRSIHWASMTNNSNYGYGPDYDEAIMHQVVGRNVADLDAELLKGPIGAGRFAMRLGDIIKYAPYVGDGANDGRLEPQSRYAVVELTSKGWQRVMDRLDDAKDLDDIAYVARPNQRTSDEPYQFSYPIDEMMVGIPSQAKEPLLTALREHGWDEERIKNQTYVYTSNDPSKAVQDAVFAKPKFSHGVVVPISKDE